MNTMHVFFKCLLDPSIPANIKVLTKNKVLRVGNQVCKFEHCKDKSKVQS